MLRNPAYNSARVEIVHPAILPRAVLTMPGRTLPALALTFGQETFFFPETLDSGRAPTYRFHITK
jgi:hypothetical protein